MHSLKEPLHEALARALAARGYHTLTPVQRAVLSAGRDRDLLVSSWTGSGKTLAFGLILARALLAGAAPRAGGPRAVVLTPTRELAAQVHGELQWLLAGSGLAAVCCTGGRDPADEAERLRARVDVVVASPGRLRDHAARGRLDLGGVAWVVLDEADELLRRGFRADVEMLLGRMAGERTTLMFTATVTAGIERLSERFQRDRLRLDLEPDAGAQGALVQEAICIAPADRDRGLVNVLRYHQPAAALVFCARRARAAALCAWLQARGFAAVHLSGALVQADRTRALAALRDGRAQVCVATDLAARGLDVPGIDLVVHADPPADIASMIHRSGRTGRAGRAGSAVFLVAPKERGRLLGLARRAGRPIAWRRLPEAAEILARDVGRIAADPAFSPVETDQDRALAAAIMLAHGPHRVAVACGRLWLAGRPGGVSR